MSENINNVNYDTECSEDYRSEIEGPWLQNYEAKTNAFGYYS